MDTKKIGIIILGVCALIAFVLTSLVNRLSEMSVTTCGCPPGECPMESSIPIHTWIGAAAVLILGALGLFLIATGKKVEKESLEKKEKLEERMRTLDENEKRIYETIASHDGFIPQSELVEKTGFPKAKVSRILDKLEGKGLAERRRSGMSNFVLLRKP